MMTFSLSLNKRNNVIGPKTTKPSILYNPATPARTPAAINPDSSLGWEEAAKLLRGSQKQSPELEAAQFRFESPLVATGKNMQEYALKSFPPKTPLLKGAIDLMSRIFHEFEYDKQASTVDTTVEQLFSNKRGVCQDFAHFAISCLRSIGLTARYVSGYLETSPPPGKPKLIGTDASHAWFDIYVPDIGWVGLDPTNNQQPNESYITVAWGRDYGDVAPVKGVVMGGGQHQLTVSVDVASLPEK